MAYAEVEIYNIYIWSYRFAFVRHSILSGLESLSCSRAPLARVEVLLAWLSDGVLSPYRKTLHVENTWESNTSQNTPLVMVGI